VDVTTREATDVPDEDSEVLAVNTLPNILIERRKVLDCPQHSLRLMKPSDKTGVDLEDDGWACLAYIFRTYPTLRIDGLLRRPSALAPTHMG